MTTIPEMSGEVPLEKRRYWRGKTWTEPKKPVKWEPVLHWLPANGPFANLDVSTDSVNTFTSSLDVYFNDMGNPEPKHNDIVSGLDKNGKMVTIKIVRVSDDTGE